MFFDIAALTAQDQCPGTDVPGSMPQDTHAQPFDIELLLPQIDFDGRVVAVLRFKSHLVFTAPFTKPLDGYFVFNAGYNDIAIVDVLSAMDCQ